MLSSSSSPLCRAYDLAMLDLDGVVYVGRDAVPGAAEHLAAAREEGMGVAFITNNASRPPGAVADHLNDLGVPATAADVVTSAQAAATVLRDRLGEGARVLLLGAAGLEEALAERGLVAVGVDDDAEAVVTGYGPQVPWGDIMRAAVRIREGLWWVASNTDGTIPTPYGIAPGHGVLVDTVRRFSGVEPVVAGKPERPLLDETVRRVGGERPLMVGDRLDTDIKGARTVGIDSLLVLTGVTGLAEVVSAREEERPSYVGLDLRALTEPQEAPEQADGSWSLGGWTATVDDGTLKVAGGGAAGDWWRVVAAAAWEFLDASGDVADTTGLTAPDPDAR
ncbi:HAD-IIA family hydrolase [Nocardioides sp.]|uniref:HAD-IIA family hydrolase n=1 Tax=Nocardioides sp. TaxID=35761 RepID=UPI0027202176|nr:HAD-IIA family hydrolase [Nocardioides sp.]MDO9455021.1 HAD-IIA family hydrolase [Nocardioides sp.]